MEQTTPVNALDHLVLGLPDPAFRMFPTYTLMEIQRQSDTDQKKLKIQRELVIRALEDPPKYVNSPLSDPYGHGALSCQSKDALEALLTEGVANPSDRYRIQHELDLRAQCGGQLAAIDVSLGYRHGKKDPESRPFVGGYRREVVQERYYEDFDGNRHDLELIDPMLMAKSDNDIALMTGREGRTDRDVLLRCYAEMARREYQYGKKIKQQDAEWDEKERQRLRKERTARWKQARQSHTGYEDDYTPGTRDVLPDPELKDLTNCELRNKGSLTYDCRYNRYNTELEARTRAYAALKSAKIPGRSERHVDILDEDMTLGMSQELVDLLQPLLTPKRILKRIAEDKALATASGLTLEEYWSHVSTEEKKKRSEWEATRKYWVDKQNEEKEEIRKKLAAAKESDGNVQAPSTSSKPRVSFAAQATVIPCEEDATTEELHQEGSVCSSATPETTQDIPEKSSTTLSSTSTSATDSVTTFSPEIGKSDVSNLSNVLQDESCFSEILKKIPDDLAGPTDITIHTGDCEVPATLSDSGNATEGSRLAEMSTTAVVGSPDFPEMPAVTRRISRFSDKPTTSGEVSRTTEKQHFSEKPDSTHTDAVEVNSPPGFSVQLTPSSERLSYQRAHADDDVRSC